MSALPRGAWQTDVLALLLAVACVAIVDLVTNANPVVAPFYLTMARDGVLGNDELVSPYAYRVVWPLLSGAVARAFSLSTVQGFEIVAYASMVALLYLTFSLASALGAGLRGSLFALGVVALSLGHLKHSLYYRTGLDPLCQALAALSVLALLARARLWALAIACLGVLVREFALILCAALATVAALDAWRDRSGRSAAAVAGILAAALGIFLAPRLLIPVVASEQFIDPSVDPDFLGTMIGAVTDWRRLFNVALGTLSYLLPLMLLVTPARLRRAGPRIAPHAPWLAVYASLVLVLTLFGGTDIFRFLTYLFVPQTFLLAVLFADDGSARIAPWEVGYALGVTALHNRAFQPFPEIGSGAHAFLDALPAYSSWVSAASGWRAAQIGAALLGAVALRRWVARRRPARGPAAPC